MQRILVFQPLAVAQSVEMLQRFNIESALAHANINYRQRALRVQIHINVNL